MLEVKWYSKQGTKEEEETQQDFKRKQTKAEYLVKSRENKKWDGDSFLDYYK